MEGDGLRVMGTWWWALVVGRWWDGGVEEGMGSAESPGALALGNEAMGEMLGFSLLYSLYRSQDRAGNTSHLPSPSILPMAPKPPRPETGPLKAEWAAAGLKRN